jgi:hypothetical protein
MKNEVLLKEKSITIEYDRENQWILVDWIGYHTVDSVKSGCERMLEFLVQYKCHKVLNDNTNVTGIWSGASAWVGGDWLPRMSAAGLKYFAWVYSPSAFSRLSTDESLRNLSEKHIAQTFDDIQSAKAWLKSKGND